MDASILDALKSVDPSEYAKAEPFPHVVMDGFLTEQVASDVAKCFPYTMNPNWKRHEHKNSKKLAWNNVIHMDSCVRPILFGLNSEIVTRQISRILGQEVIQDDTYEGGGMHMILKGGFLGIHADFNVHPNQKWIRVANLLIYLNECEGGDLEFWIQKKPTRGRMFGKSVPTAPGRAVLFTTTDEALHGHPHPLKSDFRKSLAVYYYAPKPPGTRAHSTLYV